ncbi:MAG TPA: hypothetical protein VNF68_07975, partial [Candidatus Baltobacteraceae bacterium]|nr:hypothetical protein [Candidatus Baltobacteraceae bacterium]
RIVGFQSTTSTPFSGGTLIGNIDFARLPGWYSAVDFTSVSSGTSGTSGTVPGSPLFVPNTLTLGQTWNPLQNATYLTTTGINTQAQVTSVGSVPGMSACPNSPTQGAGVQYTVSTSLGNAGFGTVYYVPGCGITAFGPGGGGSAVLQSVTTQTALGQQIVPAGQPPIVAALHKLWQSTLGRPKPPK